jgi:uncharacterized protein YprB with RNaseH-like and TPR domain/predicted nuclease with RNAse H fold/dephospho-CoA kinase
MLEHTFRHLKGVGLKKERELWDSGILSWDNFDSREEDQLVLFKDSEHASLRSSREALEKKDIEFFAKNLPREEHYRIALSFPRETLFLDIETTGLSKYYDDITLVGLGLNNEYKAYIQGDNLSLLERTILQSKVIITFNGSLFDLPFIRQEFPDLQIPQVHIDLRFLAKRVGMSGGQKKIEQQIGIKRAQELSGLEGEAAPLLWHKYCRGDLDSLKLLISYNHADIEGMKRIFDVVVERLMQQQKIPKNIQKFYHFSDFSSKLKFSSNVNSKNNHSVKLFPYQGSFHSIITFEDLNDQQDLSAFRVIGLDITGSEKRASGWCLLKGKIAHTKTLLTDTEIIEATLSAKPNLISIDSPLSLPQGRLTVEDSDPGRSVYGITRACERLLKKRGVNVYPALIQSMQSLTARGIRLAEYFRSQGIPVIESYPGAAQDIMRIPRKQAGLEFLKNGLTEFGIEGEFKHTSVSHDELDAITSAIVGHFYWAGTFEGLGNNEEDYLIIPEIKNNLNSWKGNRIIGLSGAVASGKTTLGTFLKSSGFYYTRFSLVLADILCDRKIPVSRQSLQQIGLEIHRNPGQRWLCKQILQKLQNDLNVSHEQMHDFYVNDKNIVIDGLRFPEDHAFFVEKFGSAFLHIHLDVPVQTRLERYIERGGTKREFLEASSSLTEGNLTKLASLAHQVITNAEDLRFTFPDIFETVSFTQQEKKMSLCL